MYEESLWRALKFAYFWSDAVTSDSGQAGEPQIPADRKAADPPEPIGSSRRRHPPIRVWRYDEGYGSAEPAVQRKRHRRHRRAGPIRWLRSGPPGELLQTLAALPRRFPTVSVLMVVMICLLSLTKLIDMGGDSKFQITSAQSSRSGSRVEALRSEQNQRIRETCELLKRWPFLSMFLPAQHRTVARIGC